MPLAYYTKANTSSFFVLLSSITLTHLLLSITYVHAMDSAQHHIDNATHSAETFSINREIIDMEHSDSESNDFDQETPALFCPTLYKWRVAYSIFDTTLSPNMHLIEAVQSNNAKAVLTALHNGAHCDVKSGWRAETPLGIAVSNGYLNIVDLLLTHKASIDSIDSFDQTPLKKAVYNHRTAIIQTLVIAGAHVNYAELIALKKSISNTEKIENIVKAAQQEKTNLDQQDWLPKDVLALNIITPYVPAPIGKIIALYAHYSSPHKTLNKIVQKQIKRNREHQKTHSNLALVSPPRFQQKRRHSSDPHDPHGSKARPAKIKTNGTR